MFGSGMPRERLAISLPVSPGNPYYVRCGTGDGFIEVYLEARQSYDYALLKGAVGNTSSLDYSAFIIGRSRQDKSLIVDLSHANDLDTSSAAAAVRIARTIRDSNRRESTTRLLALVGTKTLTHICEICFEDIPELKRVFLELSDAERWLHESADCREVKTG